jgi:hypothetical protein
VRRLKNLAAILGNAELCEFALAFVTGKKDATVSNCISRLTLKSGFDLAIDSEIGIAAEHFWELNPDEIRTLEPEILRQVLESPQLRIPSEDWLFDLLFSFGPQYLRLIGLVRFEYLSVSSIDTFFERISIDELNEDIWHQLWVRLRHQVVYSSDDIPRESLKDFVLPSPDSLSSGLISHLRDECGGNAHEKGLINITCSSSEWNSCWQVIDYDWTEYWCTRNLPNSWIQFDFKSRVVSLTDYTLISQRRSEEWLLEWKLSGSMDDRLWTDLDQRHTQALKGSGITKTFHCSESSSVRNFYRYIRLTQTGKNSSRRNHLILAHVELFGSMRNSSEREVFA